MPKVSVCMPTYNGEKYLREAIDSVLCQSFDDFELVITDDCSSDQTLDIVSSYDDARIHVFRNPENRGLVGNWNECLSKSRGDFIQFFFQDDVMQANNLQLKVDLMERHPDVALCFSASCIIDSNSRVTMRRRPLKGSQVLSGHDFARKSFRSHNLYGEPSNVMMRKSCMEIAGLFNDKLSYTPDWEYWIRMSLVGNVGYIDEYLTHFRVAQESTTSSLFAEKDTKLAQDERDFVAGLQANEELNLSKADIAAHERSVRLRNFEKRIYFFLKGNKGNRK